MEKETFDVPPKNPPPVAHAALHTAGAIAATPAVKRIAAVAKATSAEGSSIDKASVDTEKDESLMHTQTNWHLPPSRQLAAPIQLLLGFFE
eukprot:scaffold17685_cov169-Amphora_coffeaeformis.AAC.7